MKRTWMTMVFAAAVTTTAAMAQELKATIPFDFSAGGKQMSAGNYSVAQLTGINSTYAVRVRNTATKEVALIVSNVHLDRNESSTGSGKLVFKCYSGSCALAQVHTPGESSGRAFPTRAPKGGEKERTVAIRLTSSANGF